MALVTYEFVRHPDRTWSIRANWRTLPERFASKLLARRAVGAPKGDR